MKKATQAIGWPWLRCYWHFCHGLAVARTQSSVRSQYVELPWATHGFDYNFQGPSGQLAWYSLRRFLANTLR